MLAQRRGRLHPHSLGDPIDALLGRFKAPLRGEQALMG
jgi:hypothetical protein